MSGYVASGGELLDRPSTTARSEGFRADIQALRGFAILLVVIYHVQLVPALKAGYLGVDIFFVVSGYLITGVIQRALDQGSFTFAGFYFRRAKRLLPAAYVTLGATALLSMLFLTPSDMRDFEWQLLGAATFTGNVVLWLQTGYFEGAAQIKPLLHVWSLSIEEQYYLLLPAALVFTPRRFWRAGAVTIFAVSLVLCTVLVSIKPGATFYLLPTRAWELALGSVGCLALQRAGEGALVRWLFWPALLALAALPLFPSGAPHPGLDALIVCLATLVVILRNHPGAKQNLPTAALARLGDMSYSLYLVHWPVLAFAANAWLAPIPDAQRLGLLTLILLLAYALYRWVEKPARAANIPMNRLSVGLAIATTFAVVLTGPLAFEAESWAGRVDYTQLRQGNLGFNAACEYGEKFQATPECSNSRHPQMLVWGDSVAMHLVDGIAASAEVGLAQATKTTCGPLIGVAAFRATGFYNRRWAQGCVRFNQSVIDYLSSAPEVQVVVLSSWMEQYLEGHRLVSLAAKGSAPADQWLEQNAGDEAATGALRVTISRLHALGKRVVLVSPAPMSGFDVGRCLDRTANRKAVFGADTPSCAISQPKFLLHQARVNKLLTRVSELENVPLVRLDEFLCKSGYCAVELDGTFLYRDGGHFSHDGSRVIGTRMQLGTRLFSTAR
jgi:peptidoglycan/LPS O-acetylase OafA/YrhL